MIQKDTQHPLPPDLQNVIDEYDLAHNEEVLADYTALFEVLREMHKLHPDWRFGQLICNLATMCGKTQLGEIYAVPDETLLKIARKYVRKRQSGEFPVRMDE